MIRLANEPQMPRVLAVIVTYNSAETLPALVGSIHHGTVDARIVVVDNASADDTVAVAEALPGVTVIDTGANLGYSGGLNIGRALAEPDEAIAILNPDLVLDADALERMLGTLCDPGVGIVAPQLFDPDGTRFNGLRKEPSVLGALGDAVLGDRWSSRPYWASDTLRGDDDYSSAGDVAWAGGAALLVSAACNANVGAWDSETYFLYSEETDYARRARDAGFRVRYEPTAHATHVGGGSGQPAALIALMAVNRVRYYERHHSGARRLAFRAAVTLHHAARARDPRHRFAMRTLLSRKSWASLPAATSPAVANRAEFA